MFDSTRDRARINTLAKLANKIAGGKEDLSVNKKNSVCSNQSEEHFNESDRIIPNEIN